MSTRYDGLITQITLPKGLDYRAVWASLLVSETRVSPIISVRCFRLRPVLIISDEMIFTAESYPFHWSAFLDFGFSRLLTDDF